jgi:hypothetical protein
MNCRLAGSATLRESQKKLEPNLIHGVSVNERLVRHLIELDLDVDPPPDLAS